MAREAHCWPCCGLLALLRALGMKPLSVLPSNWGLKLWRFHRRWGQEDRTVSRKEVAMRELITLHVNGERHELAVLPHHTLLEVLRAAAGSGGAALCC